MRIRALNLADKVAIQSLIVDAFNGFPWYKNYSREEVRDIWESARIKTGFAGIVALSEENTIVGASWWYFPSKESIRGNTLTAFISNECADRVLVWEDAILIRQEYQRRGIGMILRNAFVEEVKRCTIGAVILSRMRSDNKPTLLLAERLGFKRTGARSKENDRPGVFQEFWYLFV